MATAKEEVEELLGKLPNDCSLEDIQYHLYVLEKVRHGLAAAETEGLLPRKKLRRGLANGLPSNLVAASARRYRFHCLISS